MQRARLTIVVALAVAALTVDASTTQQRGSAPRESPDDGKARAEKAVVESMAGHEMHDNVHLRVTAKRPERQGDRDRAAAIVAALKPALGQYRDYHAALRNGYEIFMPDVPQAVYHFNNYAEGFAEAFRFQPDQATSLLYRKTKSGYDLVGAMYTAPAESTEIDLDARAPLSIARWHQHVNICLPRRGEAGQADWTKFGPNGSIATPTACTAAGGRFFPRLFGWMVHVYPFEKTLERVWSM